MSDKYADLRVALDACGESDYHLHQYEETIRALLDDRDEAQARAFHETMVASTAMERVAELEAERAGWLDQHHRDSRTLRRHAQELDDVRKERNALLHGHAVHSFNISALSAERDALRAAVLAIDSLRGPFMSDDDIASVWKLVDTALAQHQGEKHDNQD